MFRKTIIPTNSFLCSFANRGAFQNEGGGNNFLNSNKRDFFFSLPASSFFDSCKFVCRILNFVCKFSKLKGFKACKNPSKTLPLYFRLLSRRLLFVFRDLERENLRLEERRFGIILKNVSFVHINRGTKKKKFSPLPQWQTLAWRGYSQRETRTQDGLSFDGR